MELEIDEVESAVGYTIMVESKTGQTFAGGNCPIRLSDTHVALYYTGAYASKIAVNNVKKITLQANIGNPLIRRLLDYQRNV